MLYFLDTAFWSHLEWVALFVASLALVIFARYLAISVLYQFLVKKLRAKVSHGTTPKKRAAPSKQIKREITWAFTASLVFAVLVALSLLAYQNGLTQVYTDIHEHSLTYFFVSPALMLVLYESYYYWLHRWMHLPRVFKHVHKVHHESTSPTVFTAFSFHPIEAFLQFIFFPAVIMLVPVHAVMLAAIFLLLSFFAVVNHAGAEIYSRGIRKFLIGASHHEIHHQQFRANFGLNFTGWDIFMKTERTEPTGSDKATQQK